MNYIFEPIYYTLGFIVLILTLCNRIEHTTSLIILFGLILSLLFILSFENSLNKLNVGAKR